MKNNANVFLAIDDKIENLISIKALIKESFSDAVVLIAQSGKEGLLLAREHNPDIILLDVMMPDMNGYDVCQILKADPVLQDIPVVFVTALSGDRETRLKAFEIGAEAFIHKPIDELELQIQLRTLLRLRHLNILKKERMNSLEEGLTNKTEALDASEQRFKIMINSISDTIGITDVNGIIKYRSPNNIPLFGIDPSETIGKQSFDFVHPDDREQIRQKLVNLVNEGPGAKQTGEFKYLRSDGSLVYVQLEGRNMIDDPIINGLLLTYRDITDKKVATRKLEEESEKLRALIESTEDLVWLVDPEDFGLITYNSALYHYFEMGRGLHITAGMKPEDLLPENFASQWKSMYHSVLEKGAYKTEYTASALSRTLLLSFYPVKVENVTIGISVLGQDITDKKKIEVALRESEERFRSIVNSMDDVVYTLDEHHRHTGIFGSWVKKNNLTDDFFIGKTSSEIFGTEVGKIHEEAISKALAGDNVVYEWTSNTGAEKIYYQTSLSPMYSPDGTVHGIVGIGRNITNIKKTESELIASKDRFIKAQEMGRFGHWSFNLETQTFE
jgi:PAS domain S-box-containing protein